MIRPFGFLALGCFLLTGCYESQTQLLDLTQARRPISITDTIDIRQGVTYHEKLAPRNDGQYEFYEANRDSNGQDGAISHHTVLLNDLGTIRGHALYAYGAWDPGEQAFVYGILVFKEVNSWKAVTPSCARNALGDYVGSEFVIALRRGARYVNHSDGVCEFASSDMLLSALRDFANSDDFWTRANDSD